MEEEDLGSTNKVKEIEMLKTKLLERKDEVQECNKEYFKSKAKIGCLRKAEIREVKPKKKLRRSTLR